jgi:hypothetical protein
MSHAAASQFLFRGGGGRTSGPLTGNGLSDDETGELMLRLVTGVDGGV